MHVNQNHSTSLISSIPPNPFLIMLSSLALLPCSFCCPLMFLKRNKKGDVESHQACILKAYRLNKKTHLERYKSAVVPNKSLEKSIACIYKVHQLRYLLPCCFETISIKSLFFLPGCSST